MTADHDIMAPGDFRLQTILLVDDNEDDVFLMPSIFRKIGIRNPVQAVLDGDEAIAYLEGSGRYRDRAQFPLPAVVLLDLNMPKRNGFEVLSWIRARPEFKHLIVHILSASMRQVDVKAALDLGANSYLVKPSRIEALSELMAAWYRVARHTGFVLPQQSVTASV
jgi:CheY-like chemotaxis protein